MNEEAFLEMARERVRVREGCGADVRREELEDDRVTWKENEREWWRMGRELSRERRPREWELRREVREDAWRWYLAF